MQDAITSVINAADVQGKYLDDSFKCSSNY